MGISMDITMDIPMDIHEKICGYGWEISYPRQAWLGLWRLGRVWTGCIGMYGVLH